MELVVEVGNNIIEGSEIFFELKGIKQSYPLKARISHHAFTIISPTLWWPNGLGAQHLYTYEVSIIHQNQLICSTVGEFGVRIVKLVQKEDSTGLSFYFMVNGVPVFARGANYIPSDSFPTRTNQTKYEAIIKSAVFANMNMLRVWGGGTYETNLFYSLCDKYGIMIWQDFMFACAMYPGDDEFLKNVQEEVTYNVKRLRPHPSVVHWCGNNEIWEAYNNWGFSGYETSARNLEKAYKAIFQKIIPTVISEVDPDRSYTHSSPLLLGYSKGDQHYWSVWHGGSPFQNYISTKGRFFSEYGFQGYPSVKTFEDAYGTNQFTLNENKLSHRQKAGIGNDRISSYMVKEIGITQVINFNDYVYKSQVLQAIGISTAVTSHRLQKPTNMGTLYWQLNDCWPVISWSSTDYYGRYKALHYAIRRANMPLMIHTVDNSAKIEIIGVNDLIFKVNATVEITLFNSQGVVLNKSNIKIELLIDAPTNIKELQKSELVSSKVDIVQSILTSPSQEKKSISVWHVQPISQITDIKAEWIQKSWTYNLDTLTITLQPRVTLRYVFLEASIDGYWEDNLIDIIANQEKNMVLHLYKKLPSTVTIEIRYMMRNAEGLDKITLIV
jgi:beta-mannosidase